MDSSESNRNAPSSFVKGQHRSISLPLATFTNRWLGKPRSARMGQNWTCLEATWQWLCLVGWNLERLKWCDWPRKPTLYPLCSYADVSFLTISGLIRYCWHRWDTSRGCFSFPVRMFQLEVTSIVHEASCFTHTSKHFQCTCVELSPRQCWFLFLSCGYIFILRPP